MTSLAVAFLCSFFEQVNKIHASVSYLRQSGWPTVLVVGAAVGQAKIQSLLMQGRGCAWWRRTDCHRGGMGAE
jgi:hypothetical protein